MDAGGKRIATTLAVLCACASINERWAPLEGPVGHWHGLVVRGSFPEAVTLDLERTDSGWAGSFTAGNRTVALDHLTVGGGSIHFETPDKLAFDGKVEGESMVGFLSGPTTGSFALSRDPVYPYALTGNRDPREPVLMFGPP
jgi:hypothetical protein